MGREGTLLVLGGSGFLGYHVVGHAAGRFSRVVSVARRPERCLAPGGESRACDALADEELEALLAHEAPLAVILAAAESRVARAAADPERATAMNTELPARVARWADTAGVRLVHVSTDLVFGGQPPPAEGNAEDTAPCPVHHYGRTKAAGESAVLEAAPRAVVVRLPLLFGDSRGRALGASDALLAELGRGETPALFHDEWRTPLDVEAAARALVELAGREERGLLHVAGPLRMSRLELGLLVLEATGIEREEAERRVRATTRTEGGSAERPADASLDARRARALLETPLPPPHDSLGSRPDSRGQGRG